MTRSGGGLSNFIGFSENVTLGQIGTLKRDDGVVMRGVLKTQPHANCAGVVLPSTSSLAPAGESRTRRGSYRKKERGGLFQFDTTEDIRRLTTQTFFLEPLESPVLFAAPRVVAMQGDLPFVRADGEGSVQSRRHDFERIMYKALSDTNEPRMDLLRNDRNRCLYLIIVTCNCRTISTAASASSRSQSS